MTTLTSPKHPNWLILKENDTHFSMWHKDYNGYTIAVFKINGQWLGEILTEQIIPDFTGETEWMPAQTNPMTGPLENVKNEVVRRGEYWNNK